MAKIREYAERSIAAETALPTEPVATEKIATETLVADVEDARHIAVERLAILQQLAETHQQAALTETPIIQHAKTETAPQLTEMVSVAAEEPKHTAQPHEVPLQVTAEVVETALQHLAILQPEARAEEPVYAHEAAAEAADELHDPADTVELPIEEVESFGDEPIYVAAPEIGIAALPEIAAIEAANQAWAAELYKEPIELVDDFWHGLEQFSALPTIELHDTTAEGDGEVVQMSPPIVTEMVHALSEMNADEKTAIAEPLRDIFGAVHGIRTLELRGAETEEVQLVKEQLQELCVALFERLELQYTDQDIQDFMAVLLDEQFVPAAAPENSVETYDKGTHETKIASSMMYAFGGTHNMSHAIGVFTLVCAYGLAAQYPVLNMLGN